MKRFRLGNLQIPPYPLLIPEQVSLEVPLRHCSDPNPLLERPSTRRVVAPPSARRRSTGRGRRALRSLLALTSSLSLLAGSVPARADEPVSGPRAEYEAKTFDLGEISKGAPARAVFKVRNAGDEPLKILKAKPG